MDIAAEEVQQNLDPSLHSKYGYNLNEKLLMVLITAITNLIQVPGLYALIVNKRYYLACIGTLTMVTSFMYHYLDSVDVYEFYFDEGHWHRIDNLGAIACFISLMVELMHNEDEQLDEIFNFSGLFMVLILQEGYPWNLEFTLIPIFMFLVILIRKYIKYGRKLYQSYHKKAFRYGLINFILAVICFSKGLDEFADYLRFYHGLWHMFISLAFFYFFQIRKKKHEEVIHLQETFWSEKIYIKTYE